MRRRLVIAIAGAVAAAVAIVGVGTLLLTALDVRRDNEAELRSQVTELAAVLDELRPVRSAPVAQRLEPTLDVDRLRVLPLDPIPYPLDEADVAELEAGRSVSHRDGNTAVAAAPLPARGLFPDRALVATDSSDSATNPALRWFLLSGGVTIVVGALVAVRIARSLTGPLVEAEIATQMIARGEPAARVPELAVNDDELGRLLHSINTMAAELDQARRAEQDFLLSVSHDLRTPLTSISGWAEALADGAARDTAAAGRTIMADAGRLDRLVRDLLDLARLRTQAFTLTSRPVDLRDVALGAGEGLRPDLEDAGLRLKVDVPAAPVVVSGDADRLAQIAGNLVENAGRHAATTVRVAVVQEGAEAVLIVEDDGPGIDPAERERVFEPLYSMRSPSAQGARAETGTGLGLATVLALTKAMGGSVRITEADLGGARLVVRLPVTSP